MDADFSVELGPPSEDATLELPWDSGDPNGPRYLDLRRDPELLQFVSEAVEFPELGDFLRALNSKASLFQTAKCDVWMTDELSEEEEIYGAECKVGCYVDLVFSEEQPEARLSFFRHEDLARSLADLLKKAPDVSAAAEMVVRRCYYHRPPELKNSEGATAPKDRGSSSRQPVDDLLSGFYVTVYLFAFADDEDSARQRWRVALQLVSNAVLQLSSAMRTH